MTYEEFLTAFDENTRAEWANGKAIVFLPPNIQHQRIVRFLFLLLGSFVELRKLGELFAALVEMRLSPEGSAREPDLLFVAHEYQERITPQRIAGPADLGVEIISPESAARDRSDKFDEYQQAGVREYWIIDPRPGLERVDLWTLDDQKKYRPVPPGRGVYHSTVLPGFWLDAGWLWAEELPNPLLALAQIVGPDALRAALS
jgi:Uma2 family endonuclease